MTKQEITPGWWLVRNKHGEIKVVGIARQLVNFAGVENVYPICEVKEWGYKFLRKLNLEALAKERVCSICGAQSRVLTETKDDQLCEKCYLEVCGG